MAINQYQQVVGSVVTPRAVHEQIVVGDATQALDLVAGRYVSVAMTGLSLSVGGQLLSADVSVDRRAQLNPDGSLPVTPTYATTVSFAKLTLRLGTPERDIVRVSDGAGTFTIVGASGGVAGGVVGRVTATVAVDVPGVTFSGGLEVRLNTLATAQTVGTAPNAVSVQPGLSVAGRDLVVVVLGQRLTGGFAFSKDPSGGTVTLGLSDVSLALGDGTTTFVTATVTTGALVVTRAGVAGSLVAGVTLNPAISANLVLAADILIQVNTTGADVTQTVAVSVGSTTFTVPKSTLRVQVGYLGRPATITLFGQTLSGVVLFEQTKSAAGTKLVRVAFIGVSLFLGDRGATPDLDRGLSLTGGSGVVLITPNGMAGSIEGDVQVVGLPLTFSARLTLEVNTLGVAVNETVQFTGVDVVTARQGTASVTEIQSILVSVPFGTFTVAVDTNANGRIDAAEVSAPLAIGASDAAVDAAIEGVLGTTNAVTVLAVTGGYAVTWVGMGNQPQLRANVKVLSLPQGPYLRLVAKGVDIGVAGITLHTDVAVDRVGPTGAKVTRVAFANASISSSQGLPGSGNNPGLLSAQGALIFFAPGTHTDSTVPGTTTTGGGFAGLITGAAQLLTRRVQRRRERRRRVQHHRGAGQPDHRRRRHGGRGQRGGQPDGLLHRPEPRLQLRGDPGDPGRHLRDRGRPVHRQRAGDLRRAGTAEARSTAAPTRTPPAS